MSYALDMNDELKSKELLAGVPLVIITGLSGAGKSSAMRLLEDLGCYCVDNLPPSLIITFFNLHQQSALEDVGVVIASDIRSGALFNDFAATVQALEEEQIPFSILYLDCSTETLIRRFKEVRRNHPLQAGSTMEEAIEKERSRLAPIRQIATHLVDTSNLTPSGLREALVHTLLNKKTGNVVSLDVMSFGFKYGLPQDADFVFDVRFLPNPFYIAELRDKTGEDEEVYNYVMHQKLAQSFFNKLANLIDITLDSFVKVGKTKLNIAIGCTGGRHRSVSFARRLAEHYDHKGARAHLTHRDISKP